MVSYACNRHLDSYTLQTYNLPLTISTSSQVYLIPCLQSCDVEFLQLIPPGQTVGDVGDDAFYVVAVTADLADVADDSHDEACGKRLKNLWLIAVKRTWMVKPF